MLTTSCKNYKSLKHCVIEKKDDMVKEGVLYVSDVRVFLKILCIIILSVEKI